MAQNVPNAGYFVRHLTIEDIQMNCETRAALECLAVRVACRQGFLGLRLIEMESSCDLMARAHENKDPRASAQADYQFHQALIALASSPRLEAATVSWANTAGGSWEPVGNWSPNVTPTSTDAVYFTNSAADTDAGGGESWLTVSNLVMGAASATQTLFVDFIKTVKTFTIGDATLGGGSMFVNGKHVPYAAPDGKTADEFNGYMVPGNWNISDALRDGANQITVLAERGFMNEVGTGGIMGLVAVCRER